VNAVEVLPVSSMDDLSAEECRFLLKIGEAGVVAFNPRENELIAFLLDGALIEAERVDDGTAILRLSSEGHTVATRLRDNMG
jgi:hypothetical protein